MTRYDACTGSGIYGMVIATSGRDHLHGVHATHDGTEISIKLMTILYSGRFH